MVMSVTTSSATVSISGSVTTSVNLPQPNATQTVINIYNDTNGDSDAYTVPANKIFYLHGATGYQATRLTIFKNDGTTQVLYLRNDEVTEGNNPSIASPVPIWYYTAGQKVKINLTAANPINIWGVLVDA